MDRFWSKVSKTDGCWEWSAALDRNGYGAFRFEGRMRLAHRISWFLHHGSFPELQLDHLCRNRKCVNPAHLEPVTNRENTIRGYQARGRKHIVDMDTSGLLRTATSNPAAPSGTAKNVAVSLRGYGDAEWPSNGFTWAQYLERHKWKTSRTLSSARSGSR